MKTTLTNSFGRLSPLAAVLLLAPLAGQAQATFSFGPRLGVNLSSAQLGGDFAPDAKFRTGALAGLVAEFGFGHFAVQPGLLFSQRGFKFKENETIDDQGITVNSTTEGDFTFNYLEIPVQAVFRQQEDGTGFQLMLGPYVGVGLSGQVKGKATYTTTVNGQTITESESESLDVVFDGDDEANDDKAHLKRLDAGVSAGLGYRFGSLLVQGGYSLGLVNIIPNSDNDESSIKNRAFQVSLTYMFGGSR